MYAGIIKTGALVSRAAVKPEKGKNGRDCAEICLFLVFFPQFSPVQCQVINKEKLKNTGNDWWDLPDVWST
jgi:hypothetical protein